MSEKETSAEARKSALESDYAALYAVAGLTDALAEALKGALAETQQKASRADQRTAEQAAGTEQTGQVRRRRLRTFVITLPEQFKHLPDATKARIAELQKQANDLLAQATTTYGDYAGRGKQAVDEVRKSARDRSSQDDQASHTPQFRRRPQQPRSTATKQRPLPTSPVPIRPLSNRRPLTPHLLARAPREQERWGVSSPPPGLT